MIKQQIPSVITSLRLIVLPHLVYSFNNQITLAAYALFLFSISTDFVDGYLARKMNLKSKTGAYLDISIDFLFISGMYLTFIVNGIYSPLIFLIIFFVFAQFIISNIILKKTVYDPVGKYYGSLLFAGIGLTLLFSNQMIYDFVTYGIVVVTLISLTSRITYFLHKKYNKSNIDQK
ncbi:hypothetical protein AC477_03825 [miscellaneous Crenarchaeota group-1 archaeon SG8-32-1]|uniref:CDP-alcohol phosphatidyltransferase n=1 Tax=miscellaneous Crenarchaeota group-1 archaeon SG8-32-1 TaxID=1685124 RepID=A0A0M0BT60_9ARCH|nr:MAG: hypothetical protein AC477_03825 [miscellaneous Crenarchaeota group-1 archaeon SG8-32-1]